MRTYWGYRLLLLIVGHECNQCSCLSSRRRISALNILLSLDFEHIAVAMSWLVCGRVSVKGGVGFVFFCLASVCGGYGASVPRAGAASAQFTLAAVDRSSHCPLGPPGQRCRLAVLVFVWGVDFCESPGVLLLGEFEHIAVACGLDFEHIAVACGLDFEHVAVACGLDFEHVAVAERLSV